jgi:hypothetical protein
MATACFEYKRNIIFWFGSSMMIFSQYVYSIKEIYYVFKTIFSDEILFIVFFFVIIMCMCSSEKSMKEIYKPNIVNALTKSHYMIHDI